MEPVLGAYFRLLRQTESSRFRSFLLPGSDSNFFNMSHRSLMLHQKVIVVDTLNSLDSFLDLLSSPSAQLTSCAKPQLYLDIEGVDLGRYGSVSLVSVHHLGSGTTHLVDFCALSGHALTRRNHAGWSLKGILESAEIVKVFFDVRNDSDALFSLYGVRLANVHDVQLMALAASASRRSPGGVAAGRPPRPRVPGLAACIRRDLPGLSAPALENWKQVKERGTALFRKNCKAVAERPLDAALVQYAAQDVSHLPLLWDVYNTWMVPAVPLRGGGVPTWWPLVLDGSHARILESQARDFNPLGKTKTVSPWAEPGSAENRLELLRQAALTK